MPVEEVVEAFLINVVTFSPHSCLTFYYYYTMALRFPSRHKNKEKVLCSCSSIEVSDVYDKLWLQLLVDYVVYPRLSLYL